jgi:hypothetical protein
MPGCGESNRRSQKIDFKVADEERSRYRQQYVFTSLRLWEVLDVSNSFLAFWGETI